MPHSIKKVWPLLAVKIVLLDPGHVTGVAEGKLGELIVEEVTVLDDCVVDEGLVVLAELTLVVTLDVELMLELELDVTNFTPQMPPLDTAAPSVDFK